jgi:hypothetical protein
MTFQLESIYLYSKTGQCRAIDFELGKLNIITGASRTGKSSVLDIIDYCLGSSQCEIPVGVIRNNVSVFAAAFRTTSGRVISARPAPEGSKKTSTRMYVGFHDAESAPLDVDALAPNMDLQGARGTISHLTGITDNLTDTGDGTRHQVAANIRHSLYFVMQAQEEIASPSVLFHSQGEQFVPQAIRDVLPFFLGVVDPEYIRKLGQLRAAERELRQLERSLRDEESISRVPGRILALIREAIESGLLPRDAPPADNDAAIDLLRQAMSTPNAPMTDTDTDTDSLDEIVHQRSELRRRSAQLRHERENIRQLLSAQSGFNSEAREHGARLRSVGLLPINPDESTESRMCPLCDSQLEHPTVKVSELLEDLQSITSEIETVESNVPGLQSLLAENELAHQEVNSLLRENQQQIDSRLEIDRLLAETQDQAIARATIRGRISLFLDSFRVMIQSTAVSGRVEELRKRIEDLRSDIDPELVAARLESAISRVSNDISIIARRLQLEHSDSPVRLDPRGLTIVVDTDSGPRNLREIGSGENLVGYHIAALLALHEYFIVNARPVPRILMLDQPSQVYFPADTTSEDPELDDEDREALSRLLSEVQSLVSRFDGLFQVILLDHADLATEWFQDAVVERWRDGVKLIPLDWLGDTTAAE